MIYIFLFILLLFLSFHYDFQRGKVGREWWYYIIMATLILTAGLRYRLGTDTTAYIFRFYHLYPTIENISFDTYGWGEDPLYALLNAIVKSIGGRFYIVQIIQSSIVIILICIYIKRHSKYIFTCVLFFFFISYIPFTMEIMRCSISIAICFFGNDYIQENKWIKGYLLYTIALLFHIQTLVIFILPSLFFIRLNRIGIVSLFLAFLLGLSLKEFLVDSLSLINDEVIEGEIEDKLYSKYGDATGNMFNYIGLILFKLIYPFFALLYVKIKLKKEELACLEPFVILGLMFVLIQLSLPVAFRYVYFYELYFAIIYSEVFINMSSIIIRKMRCQIIIKSLFLFFPLFFYYGYTRYRTHKYHPYSSVIEKSIDYEREKVFQERHIYYPPNRNEY